MGSTEGLKKEGTKYTGKHLTESTMARYIARIRNTISGLQHSDSNIPPQGVSVNMGEGDYGREDKRKMSFFNPLDTVPKYEFYAKDTWSGHIKSTRPSLDVLRKPVSKATIKTRLIKFLNTSEYN